MELEILTSLMSQASDAESILACNRDTTFYGITITPTQALELAVAHSDALVSLGRVELGGGVTDKIIRAFCSSPYIPSRGYTELFGELVECFYEYKNESLDLMGDDELINRMRALFDGVCKGSVELLRDRELAKLAQKLRYGYIPDDMDEDDKEDDEEEVDDEHRH